MNKAAILTISSTRTLQDDVSGSLIEDIVTDDKDKIREQLLFLCDELKPDIIFSVGGTGLGPHDFTPEATVSIIDRSVPGLSELIRSSGQEKTRRAMLSRGISGVRGSTLIINLPGSPKGAGESLEAITDLLPHAVEMLKGGGH
ncbi:molybdenum cofactor biosynthesis protein B [Elusimicrobiota bacterium]